MRGALSPLTLISRSSGFVQSAIDGEIVALNIETGTCYGLNSVGSRIWSLLEKPISVSSICATLMAEYQVEPEVCERDVVDLIEHLLDEGLIVTTDPT